MGVSTSTGRWLLGRAAQAVAAYRPRSVLRLALVAIVATMLPLLLALAVMAVFVGMRGAEQNSAYAAVRGALVSSSGAHLLAAYAFGGNAAEGGGARADGAAAAGARGALSEALSSVPEDTVDPALLSELHAALAGHGPGEALPDPRALRDPALRLVRKTNAELARRIDEMEPASGSLKRAMLWVILLAVPAAALLAGGFAFTIARPIRSLDRVVRRLGSGDFSGPVRIEGPADLMFLAERLEWLRVRLAEHEREKDKFLRRVSHELKTPLSAIREGADLLSEEVVGRLRGEQRDVARIIRDSSVELMRLIEELLSFSRAQRADDPPTLRLVDLAALIARCVDGHRLAIRARKLSVTQRCEPAMVLGDEARLAVVVDNLLSNAVKFTPPEGVVRVQLRAAGGRARLDVVNTGPGFAGCERDRVFESFYRGANSPAGDAPGSGLGLAIARELARAHGGVIELVDNPAGFAHVRVELPLARAGTATATAA